MGEVSERNSRGGALVMVTASMFPPKNEEVALGKMFPSSRRLVESNSGINITMGGFHGERRSPRTKRLR